MEPFDLREWPGFVAAGGDPSHPAIIDQVVIDSRQIASPNALFVALEGRRHDGHAFVQSSNSRYALVRKGHLGLQVETPLRAMQEIATLYRKSLPCEVMAITGSYGKTMVKDLLCALLSTKKNVIASPGSYNSQIGVPLSLFTLGREHEIALIEAAISEVGEMDMLASMIAPDHAILTHVGKKHLLTLGSLETAEREYLKLTTHAKGIVFLPETWKTKDEALPHAISSGDSVTLTFPTGEVLTQEIPFGYAYYPDLLNLALKPAWRFGIPFEEIQKVLAYYSPEPIRTEIWHSPIGTTFINDSFCSDPQSVDIALRYFNHAPPKGKKIFIFGGMRGGKNQADYQKIKGAIENAKLDRFITVGNCSIESTERTGTYEEAFSLLKGEVQHTDTILIKGEKRQPLNSIASHFNDSITTNQCWINLAAIEANIKRLQKKTPRIMVMVKAMGYGTDPVHIAKHLQNFGIDLFGVSYVDEGVALRRAGIEQGIFALNAADYEAAKVVKWDFEVGISEKNTAAALAEEATRQGRTVKVHLHVDTGMSRLGCCPEEALELAQWIHTQPGLKLEGIMTHFACAEDPEQDPFTLSQAQTFDEVISSIPFSIPWKHACNSSALIRFDFPQYNMARLGLSIFGLFLSDAVEEDLRLAISLTSRIVGINHCKKGESIGYGRRYTVDRGSARIAVIPIGFFDGLHRNYSGKGWVVIRGQKAPMVGTISMDYMMVDITDIPEAKIGDPVLLFGEDEYGNFLAPEVLAKCGGSIIHELVTCLGPRIQRVFIHEEKQQLR